MEVEGSGGSKQNVEMNGTESKHNNNNNKKKKNAKYRYLPRFSCLRTETDGKGNFDMQVQAIGIDGNVIRPNPTHLVVMVNGIIGSAQNWRYAAKQFCCRYPEDVIVHCSERNSGKLTFDGVDVMGDRLAEEVISVIKRHPSVQKISFIGHSLGGLVARYAIARLYEKDVSEEVPEVNGECRNDGSGDLCQRDKFKGKIAGLEPMNFITCATPHLGSRGHKQVPLFCGFYTLEKAAVCGSWLLGRTGKHLFLTDHKEGKPPLLFQMVSDCEDLKFISALQSFRRRVAYANARFDQLVGWSTSSLRHPSELPKRRHLKRVEKYKHIVNVEMAAGSRREVRSATIAIRSEINEMQEEMLRGLTTLSWERVDVYFRKSRQRFLAHNTIQVQAYCIHSDGAEVIQHMIDNFLL